VVPAGLPETGRAGQQGSHAAQHGIPIVAVALLGVEDRLIDCAEKRQLGLQEIQQGPMSQPNGWLSTGVHGSKM
jgi:hypothetical protein